MVSNKFARVKFVSKHTCDERIIMQCQKNVSRNIIIQSAAYDAVYETLVIPAQKLKDVQQEIANLRQIKITKQMNPLETRMNPDSTSGIFVSGEARAHTRIVDKNRKKAAREKQVKKAAAEQRNLTNRDNREKAFRRLRETVAKNESDSLQAALTKHKPATDFGLALQHLGTKPSSLPNGKKATIIDAIVRLHSSNDDPSTFEPIGNYDKDKEINSDIELEEI